MFEKSSSSSIYRIYLLRHGQSTGNARGVYQGQANYPLDPAGIRQAEALARRWKTEGISFNRIFSSPLLRARQTAEIISAGLGNIPLDFDSNWMERNNGSLSGLRPEEAESKHPRPAFFNPYTPVGETGESNWALYLRAGQAVNTLLSQPMGCYLIVSHGAILNMTLYVMLGIIPQASFAGARFRFSNAAFATLTYIPNRHLWYLEGVNDHAHCKSEAENAA
jgi:broad specificity phosphatase PhoE